MDSHMLFSEYRSSDNAKPLRARRNVLGSDSPRRNLWRLPVAKSC
jgi:hypothetical protein